MKKRCAWLLTLIFLVTLSVSGMAYATGEDEETRETEETVSSGETEDTETMETTQESGQENDGQEPEQEPEKALQEILDKSSLEADEVIADGIYIGEVAVGGMTAGEALEAVLSRIEGLGEKTLTLMLDGAEGVEPIQVPVSELGLRAESLADVVMEAVSLGKDGNLIARYKAEKDLQVSNQVYEYKMSVDKNLVNRFVTEKTGALGVEPEDAQITRTGGKFSISESKTGVKVDIPATVSAIMAEMEEWKKEDTSVTAVAEIIQPECTTEMLAQIQDDLGHFSASTNDRSSGKLQNLDRGVELTNGILIMPGESWSMHDALAPFSAANGYTQQIAYQSGGYVKEYGGGICQLATTLYNAALRAEVEISKRSNHSMVVYYTDFGLDATINDGGSKDLELTNSFDFPIYIEGYHDGDGRVTYTIWGKETRPSNREVSYYGVTLSKQSVPEQIIEDPTKPVGYEHVEQSSSYPAVVAEAYKEIKIDGVTVEKIKLHTDKYIASPRKIIRGTAVPVDPNTGWPIDPATGLPINPATGQPEAPQPETPAPQPETPTEPTPQPETPAPTDPAPQPEPTPQPAA
ncbi:MAG: vanomycin resistance protein VanB [Lachnospiraceae bacterium]|nr:vanomycin resistance protein VanB [Lachnospiraceae bacterium]